MASFRISGATLTIALALSAPSIAQAQSTDVPPPPRAAWLAWDARFSGVWGGYGERLAGGLGHGVAVGAMGTFRYGPLEIGGLLQVDAAAGGELAVTTALVGGVAFQLGTTRGGGPRLEALWEIGADSVSENEGEVFGAHPGATVAVEGVRFGATYRFGEDAHRGAGLPGIGLWVVVEHDSSRDVASSNCDLLGCDSPTMASVGGGHRVGVLLTAFVDIGPR